MIISTESILKILPEVFLAIGIVTILGYGVIVRGRRVSLLWTITDLSVWILIGTLITEWAITAISNPTSIIKMIILVGGIIVLLASKEEMADRRARMTDNEYNQIVMLAIRGMMLMISARDMMMMYLAIETMSLSSYIMASLRKTGQYSTEAGLKYIVLGAISSGIILLGISQIYIITGTIEWEGLNQYMMASRGLSWGVELGGLLIIVAILFKLGVAPLHMWVPDVYEGAPTIVTMFFAIVPKLAVMYLLIILISLPLITEFDSRIQPLLMITALISIIVGSVGAINQTKIKRVIAYSAIAHMGWVVLGLAVGTLWALQAAVIYMIIYMIMGMNIFSIILNQYVSSGNNYIIELSGLARREPVIAITLSLALLSIAGVPPLAGFYSKYNIIIALLEEGWLIVSIIAILVSVVGAYYYLRIIQLMFFNDSQAYLSKQLADLVISDSVLKTSSFLKWSSFDTNNIDNNINKSYANANANHLVVNQVNVSALRLGIISITIYFIITYLIYPNPLIVMTYEAIKAVII